MREEDFDLVSGNSSVGCHRMRQHSMGGSSNASQAEGREFEPRLPL